MWKLWLLTPLLTLLPLIVCLLIATLLSLDACVGRRWRLLRTGVYDLTIESFQKMKMAAKQLDCTICGKQFKKKHHLDCHLLIHSKKKPFKCGICGKKFKTRSNLTRHFRSHQMNDRTNVLFVRSHSKPFLTWKCIPWFGTTFVCFCDEAFTQISALYRHIRSDTKEAPHFCLFCGYVYRCSSSLEVHILRHLNEKPRFCEKCPQEFLTARMLRTHISRGCNGKKKKR